MIKKILTIILLSILAFNVNALDILSVNTNNWTLNRSNFSGSSITINNLDATGSVTTTNLTVAGTNLQTTLAGKLSTSHTNDPVAHTELFATKYNASNPSNFVDSATVTNIVASLQTANYVVNLTTNKLLGYTFAPTNATYFGDCSGLAVASAGTVSVPIGTNGNYAFAWGCTNTTFTSVEGSYVNGELFCAENEAGDMTVKVEIYRRDIVTDVLSEWGDGGAPFTVPDSATPTLVLFSVYVPTIDTNAFRVWVRIKRVDGNATSGRLLIVGSGSGTTTHYALIIPASAPINAHNADSSAHPFIQSLFSAPYKAFTGTITPANGTSTVTYAVGNMPSLTLTAPTVLTLDPASYGTSGVSRVSLSLYCGTNAVTLATNVITYATTPTLSTNCYNTILIRRVSNCVWKGVQL